MDDVKEEMSQLKAEIADKEAQIRSQEELLKQERQRREGENGELRNLLFQEQQKALEAAREAERLATEIRTYKEKADRAEFDVDTK